MAAASERKKKYDQQYQKDRVTMKAIKFFHTTDQDILEFLKDKTPFSTYIKKLIREEIKRSQK